MVAMIYTIGERSRYDSKLDLPKPLYKLGRGFWDGTFHPGGSVWRTAEEAEAFILENRIEGRGVYGVLADWEADTVQLPREPFRRLVNTSQIVRLPATGGPGEAADADPLAPDGR